MRLYELNYGTYNDICPDPNVKVKKVSLFSPFIKGEKKTAKTLLTRWMFYLNSKGDFRIYYVTAQEWGRPIHTSYVTGAGPKFPFMNKGDIHIGPCYTAPDHRGQGIYRRVLKTIHAENHSQCTRAYMIVDETNLPSIKGIEAAGLTYIGRVERQGIRKIYRRVSHV